MSSAFGQRTWLVASTLAIGSSLAVVPGALNRFTLGPLLALGLAAIISLWVRPRGSLPAWMVFLTLAGTIALIVAALASGQPLASLFGRWPRYEGFIAVGGYAIALVLGSRLFGLQHRATLGCTSARAKEFRAVQIVIAAVASIHAIVSVLDVLGVRVIPGALARSGALLGNATDQALLGATFAVLLARPALGSGIARVGFAAGLIMVMASGSRSGLLAVVIGLLVLGVLELVVGRQRKNAALFAGGAGGVVLIAVMVPTIAPRLIGTSPLALETVADRFLIWGEALQVYVMHPVLGVGPSGFLDSVSTVHGPSWFATVSPNTVLDSPHSLPLQLLVAGGPLAVVIAGALTFFVVRAALSRLRNSHHEASFPIVAAISAVSLGLLANPSSVSVVTALCLLVGALVAEPPHPTTSRRIRGLAFAIVSSWLLLVSTTLTGEIAMGLGTSATDAASADRAFTVAAAFRPWDVDSRVIAAESLTARVDRGEPDSSGIAIRWAEAALTASPRSLSAGRASITLSLATGDVARAREVTNSFRSLAPRDPWFAHRSGVISLLAGDLTLAEHELLAATELDPSWDAPWETLAYLYEQQGRLSDAKNATSEAQSRSEERT